jgi:hypothetical protein
MKTTQGLRIAVLAVGLAALTAPALAQTGSPNATGSEEINRNLPPKGNIGTSSQDPGGDHATRPGTSGMGPGSSVNSGSATTPASQRPDPNAEIKNNVPPKGNVDTGSSTSPGGPSR